ncbi:type IV pilin protein [Cryptosporangium arvum]|uniref:Prepilin-type N-terminal cleavage/methylation domain-containing protein n=1 Tax=Cryptosporangium arvum DSM 44712 TaxID=927661 RepID=A0A010ZV21_9ACTN|nr:prepilin-type N-terminal cleavage/methylation domain-containing protein [Cryptosporangium arvum]EXG81057.1 prepilin-type N-terminal cleavage/methylation domain-containing protein [Cryptosporangium arvum DSM 44712]
MTALLRWHRARRRTGDEGFTLIELLVVVVIIGVLIAIAVPLYNNYKKGAQNTAAQSDVRNGVTAVEAFYTANGNQYPQSVNGTLGNPLKLTLAGGTPSTKSDADQIAVSAGNQLILKTTNTASGTTQPGYAICGWSSTGKNVYVYKSVTGKTIKYGPDKTTPNIPECKIVDP